MHAVGFPLASSKNQLDKHFFFPLFMQGASLTPCPRQKLTLILAHPPGTFSMNTVEKKKHK